MSARTFLTSKGRINELAKRVIDADPTDCALFMAYYQGSIEADVTLEAHLTKAAVDAGNTIATFDGYGLDNTRELASISRTITGTEQWCDAADLTLVSVGGVTPNTLTRAMLYYDDATGVATASAVVAGTPAGTIVPGVATQNWEVDVTIDGGSLQQLAIAVDILDDYDTIAATLSAAITGGTCAFAAGAFVVTSTTTGLASEAIVAAGTLGTTSDLFAAITAAAAGNPAITFPTPTEPTALSVPLVHYQFDITTTGVNLVFASGASGLYRTG